MSIERKYLICFSLTFALALAYYGCSSGEYELEKNKIDYVDKTLKYDTVNKVVTVDTTKKETYITKDTYTYIVQIGAFIVESNFQRFFEESKSRLGDQVTYEFEDHLYKIRFGRFSDKAEAIKQLNYVKERGYSDAFIATVKR
jgi:cell division protein FtsN